MRTIGLYVHLPFCAAKCVYCDFCSFPDKDDLIDAYQRALLKHLREFAPRLEGYEVDTVYFGGGTPTHYGAKRLSKLLSAIDKDYKISKTPEITLEANPESIRRDDLKLLRRDGFNRISIGVQTLNNAQLSNLGRLHNAELALDAVLDAHLVGFDNISIDVIYGLPGQSREDWALTLSGVLRASPKHISAYGLKIERNTPLWRVRRAPDIPDDDMQADMYLYAVDTLAGAGYTQYEISNFAKKGFESKHNLKYWLLEEYASFGASAASFLGNSRYSYLRSPEAYIEAVESGTNVVSDEDSETLNAYSKAAEYIMLGLRTTRGITRQGYEQIYRGGFDTLEKTLATYEKLGFAKKRGDAYLLTPKGFLLSNRLIGELLDAQAERKSQVGTPWREDDYYTVLG
ncbi:MAG: radical SAM family heme chaperone HemW [Oscillospiraceae bacterium]|nr:radical SAM family heme chaperone HemW [Oscillospiraceae bacterium]